MYANTKDQSDFSIFLQIPENDRFSSRSSSFSDYNSKSSVKFRRTVSLEDLFLLKNRDKMFTRSKKTRRSTQLTPRKKKDSKRSSNDGSRRNSKDMKRRDSYKDMKRRDSYKDMCRRSSYDSRQSSYRRNSNCRQNSSNSRRSSRSRNHSESIRLQDDLPEDQIEKHRKRKIIVITIIVIFFILSFISILAVIISLTHRSTVALQTQNATLNVTYYTFSADPHVLCQHEIGNLW